MPSIRCIVFGVVVFLFCAAAWGQAPPSTKAESGTSSADIAAYIAREFGPDFTPVPTIPPIVADLNRDGREDVAIIATCAGSPLALSEKMHYKVEDPYGRYFGFSNPAISTQFSTEDPKKQRHILIVHDWRGASGGPKFVLVNIPFERIKLGYMLLRKHSIQVIEAEDEIGVQAAVYWDGRRYRWEATSMSDHQ